MKSQRDKINEEHRRAARSGKAGGLPTTLPSVPTPRRNDNENWLHKFKLARYPGGDPASFDVDTHH
jgi:hypothetical protein